MSSNTNIDLFHEFSKNPKGSDLETIKGSHRFINDVIQGREEGPKKSVLISIFNEFVEGEIKDYIYNKMKKSILLELALCILQEIGSYGVDHAKNLQLKLVKTSVKGKKQLVINHDKESGPEFPISSAEESAPQDLDIDEAIFNLSDSLGRSPDFTVHSAQGKSPSYLPPDEEGYFTPTKSAKKSLSGIFKKVSQYN